ncbi:MAG: sulfite exporter TauE/SafE family protein [Bryobacteraceae bacterium]|jgi:uncharacterized membrane protein YfcA
MTSLEFTGIVFGVSLVAGFIGALTGLGGGAVITPALTLLLGVDLRYAIGATIVSVIATSSGAAAAFVREGFTNIRIGMFLEVATTIGALVGAFLATKTPTSALAVIFGLVLLQSAWQSLHGADLDEPATETDGLAVKLRLEGSYPGPKGPVQYHARGVKAGFGLMFGAGIMSGLLGLGSGVLKVIAMDRIMRIPFKVSTTTSNFMIGVTAAASAGIYLSRGYIDPRIAMPVMLGVVAGSVLGARHLVRLRTLVLRRVFGVVVALIAIEMIYNGILRKV